LDNKSVVAVDLGGTWMRAVVVHIDGTTGEYVRRPTQRMRNGAAIVTDVIELIDEACLVGSAKPAESDSALLHGVALGIPTTLDAHGGLAACNNLPTLTGFRLGDILAERLGVRIHVANDALCFAVGEWWMGAMCKAKTLCGITLGTGIGLGLVIDGKPHRGATNQAGEIWRSPFKGKRVESWCSAAGIEEMYAQRSGATSRAEAIAEFARNGDAVACGVFRSYGESLGEVLAIIVNVIDPEAVVLGGSVSKSFDLFGEALHASIRAGTGGRTDLRVVPSMHLEKAALWGAARLYWDAHDERV
jgi:glucokinase